MSTTSPQFLYSSNVFGNASEVINGARTARRLLGAEGCASGFSDVLDNAGCDVLMLQPCVMADDGTVDSWQMATFRPETAPWYTGSDASVDAYGFYIEEWTGLDGAHHGRSTTGIGANRGGAYFGPMTHSHRVMKLNVLLLGASEAGLTHLFRWLEDTLLRCCSGCGDVSMWVREFCPPDPVSDPEQGLARLARVVLLEGPTWEAPITERSGASVRRASFTIAAGDPCMYGPEIACASGTNMTSSPPPGYIVGSGIADDGLFVPIGGGLACTPSFSGVADYGVLAPRVTISSALKISPSTGERASLPDFRISAYANPGATAIGPTGTARKMGELVISGRGGSGLIIEADLAERKVRYRERTGSGFPTWTDGSRLIGRPIETSVKRWWSLRACDYGEVVVEPAYLSLYNATTGAAAGQQAYDITIEMIPRWSCC